MTDDYPEKFDALAASYFDLSIDQMTEEAAQGLRCPTCLEQYEQGRCPSCLSPQPDVLRS